MSAKVPLFPLTRSPLLTEFKRALNHRSKAIKHTVFNWTLQRETDRIDGAKYESLINSWTTTGPDITLQLWHDGALRFYAREMNAQQVTFELSFYATLGSAPCDQLVHVLEQSKTPLCVRESPCAAKEAVLKLWSPFSPFDLDYRGS